MKKILALSLLGMAAAAPMAVVPAFAQSVAQQSAENQQTVTFTVENMTCALCPVTVKRAMEGVEGVRAVDIDFEARTATVVFNSAATSADAIAAASASAGYPAVAGI